MQEEVEFTERATVIDQAAMDPGIQEVEEERKAIMLLESPTKDCLSEHEINNLEEIATQTDAPNVRESYT